MKKLLFTFFGLILFTSLGWGAVTTETYLVGDTATKYSWTATPAHPDLYLGANITINATHDGAASVTNGTYSGSQWYVYMADNNGKFSISANNGYWIQSIAFLNNAQNGAVIKKVGTSDVIDNNRAPYTVNAQSINLFVDETTSTTKAKNARIKEIIVTYDVAPTDISLNVPAAMNATVGNKFQIIATVAPSTTVFQAVKWTTSNASAVDVDQNGVIDVKGAGQATITATTVNGKTATCVIDVSADAGENFIEDYTKLQATSGSYSGKKTYTADNGINWMARNYKKEDATKIGGYQGVELPGGNNYIAYNTAQEGGVKSISFQWRATDATKPVLFNIDDMSSTIYKTHLTPNADYANAQTYSRDIQYNENMYLRIRVNTDEVAQADLSPIVFGPITITPYLFYTNKSVDVYTDGYINNDLINNTSGEDVVYSLIGDGDSDKADIAPSTGAITIKAEGTVTVQASWNGGKVTTKYTATLHKSPAPEVAFTDGEAVTKSMNLETYTNALNWTSDPTKCGAVTYESDNEEVAKFEDETVNVLSIVGAGKVNITAHIAKGSEFAAKDLTYELTVEDPNEDAITETFKAYKEEGWNKNETAEAEKTGDYFKWNVYLARHATTDLIESERATCFNAGDTKDGYIVSKTAVEGGIKRIGFNWKKNGVANGTFQVIVGSNTHTINSGATTITKAAYNHNFFEKSSNATLKIFNNTQSKLWVGEIKITPYLLYTRKDTTISAVTYVGGTYSNDKLYNNTNDEGTISYSIEEADEKADIATIDDPTSGIVSIHGAGTVKVIASWDGGVTTSYNLTIEKATPTIEKFDNKTYDIFETYSQSPEAKIGDDVIAEPVFEYSVEDENIAYVDASGNVIIKATGQTNVICTLKEGATYKSVSQTKYLKVTEPTNGCWKETFNHLRSNMSDYLADTTIYGRDSVLHWRIQNFRRNNNDLIKNADNENEQGMRFGGGKANGISYLNTEEGGVKALFFNWRITGSKTVDVYFNINAKGLENPIQEHFESVASGGDKSYSYAKELNLNQNDSISISLTNQNDASVVFGPVTIKPYLLYTLKADTINMADYSSTPYINNTIINNTDVVIEAGQEAIEFSALPTSVATINEEGKVTVHTPGDVTITAKWGNITTTYTLHINRLDLDPSTLTFQITDDPVVRDMNAEPFNNVLTVPEGAGEVTYTSNKPKVATVDLNSGLVTIIGAGTATITANVADGTLYNKTSKAYTLEVTEPAGEKSYTETFKAYKTEGWTTASTDVTTKEGDYFKWDVLKARHDGSRDHLYTGDSATWLNNGGYIRTKDTLQGGIKRISFKWNKVSKGSKRALFSLFWTEDNTGYDQVDVNPVETGSEEYLHNPDFDYSHNFFLKRNVPLRIVNSGSNAVLVLGEIKITPYIFFTDSFVEKKLSDVGDITFKNGGTIDNTHGTGVMRYTSSNEEVATVDNAGNISAHKDCDAPIRITAIWKESADATDSVMAWFKLKINAKSKHMAYFEHDTITIKLNETPVNTLGGYDIPANPTYSSSETSVASIVSNAVQPIGIGTSIVKAFIPETKLYQADSATYVLVVKPVEDAEHTLEESFDGVTFTAAAQQNLQGDLAKYGITWDKNDVSISRNPDQTIGGKQGTWMRQAALLTTSNVMEGGVKYFSCNWRQPNTESNTIIKVGLFLDDAVEPVFATSDRRINDQAGVGSEQQYYYAANVAQKSNAKLTFKNLSNNEDATRGRIIFDTIKVVPYLFYTAKDTTLVANEMSGVYTYTNGKLIDNTEDAVADNFTYTVRAKDNAVSIANEHAGELTIIGAGTDTIEAAWEGVKTTYVVHVVLEDAALNFAEKTPVVLLGTGSYTQTASKSTTADVKYEFEGEHGTASINESTGEVTFNGQTGELHILASVPVALPYNLDSARYTLTVNNKPTPEVVFENKTVDMNAAAFTPEAKTIPGSGMGTASYESSDLTVAKIEEGKVTIVGEGTSTISVHYDEGDEWGEADVDFLLTVTDVLYEDSIKETFANDADWQKACTTEIDIDGLFGWKTYLTRHRSSGDNPDCLTSGEQATWFNTSGDAYLKSAIAVEGGIKRVAFNWKKETVTAPNVPSFTVKVDNEPLVVDATDRTGVDQRFNHNYFVKKNVVLEIDNNTASLLRVGAIKITPYLFYETKKCTLDLKVKDSFKNEDLIDNRDDKATSSISYSIIAGNEGSIAEIAADGTVTATAGGEITVQAQWSSNTSVTTTYILTILPAKTTINLMRNDGTEDKDVIENTIGQIMPEITLPTRTGYRFNAYFIDQACTAKRFTVTTLTYTGWVSNITYNKVNYTGDDRIWTYGGNDAVTLYADWKQERTITLDNQEATEAGTEEVITAYCPNNNLVNLMDLIEVPQKTDSVFGGYFTDKKGKGTQLIDATGAFIANVAGYTDTEKNYRKWIKDADITLYAYWESNEITLNDNNAKNDSIIAANAGKTANVTTNRTIAADMFNTLCLPFNVDAAQMAEVFGADYQLVKFTEAKLNENENELYIRFNTVENLEAGVPYLIKTSAKKENITFQGVKIVNTTGASIGEGIKMYGIMSPTVLGATEKSHLIVVANDKLAWVTSGDTESLNGMRAYLRVEDAQMQAAIRKNNPRLILNGTDTTTELVQNAECTMHGVRKLLINGQLYIEYQGRLYNVLGL